MTRQPVDLSAHINATVERGHPADFPVTLKPVLYKDGVLLYDLPKRMAVVREDTGEALAIVSDRYTLVPHQRILDLIEAAIEPLDVGPVPRGLYVDRGGARMRTLLKFPRLAQPVTNRDFICPCLKIENSYDTRSRIAVHIGAFRFVCTNLAVGGGGVFAGGFVSVHAGAIPIEEVATQLATFLQGFEAIVQLYRTWSAESFRDERLEAILKSLPTLHARTIRTRIADTRVATIYDAYNVATYYATHETRSFRIAFELLERINREFQTEPQLAQVTQSDGADRSSGLHALAQ